VTPADELFDGYLQMGGLLGNKAAKSARDG
jgi:hypothetical protein